MPKIPISKTDTKNIDWNFIYSHNPEDKPWSHNGTDVELIRFLKKHKVSKNSNVLDVGCGNGRHIPLLLKKGFRVWGIDISEFAVKFCEQKFTKANCQQGSVCKLLFPSSSFELVIDKGCFHTLYPAQRTKALSEIHRVLKPNGVLFISVFRCRKESSKPFRYACSLLPEWGFTTKQLCRLIKNYFKIEEVDELPGGTEGLLYLVLRPL